MITAAASNFVDSHKQESQHVVTDSGGLLQESNAVKSHKQENQHWWTVAGGAHIRDRTGRRRLAAASPTPGCTSAAGSLEGAV